MKIILFNNKNRTKRRTRPSWRNLSTKAWPAASLLREHPSWHLLVTRRASPVSLGWIRYLMVHIDPNNLDPQASKKTKICLFPTVLKCLSSWITQIYKFSPFFSIIEQRSLHCIAGSHHQIVGHGKRWNEERVGRQQSFLRPLVFAAAQTSTYSWMWENDSNVRSKVYRGTPR